MQYISLDLETTSLVADPKNILQIAMVLEDSEADPLPLVKDLPYFSIYIKRDTYEGQPTALAMNQLALSVCAKYGGGESFEKDGDKHTVLSLSDATEDIIAWFSSRKLMRRRVVLAGKNVGIFDYQFLPGKIKRLFSHRTIDVGSVFIDWKKEGLPTLKDLLGCDVKHCALSDARDVIKVLRRSYPIKDVS